MTTAGQGILGIIRSGERGHFDHGWLDTYHTFSFGEYDNPAMMGFRSLRVMNEDRVAAGTGFGTHPHRDMEILTYVLEGTLAHSDSLGHGGPIRAGEFQPVHLYQIWLFPERKGLEPGYEQRSFNREARLGRWQVVASPDGRDGSLTIRQDAIVSVATIGLGETVAIELAEDRHGWLQVIRGRVAVDGIALEAGDAAAITPGSSLAVEGGGGSEVMLFNLA
jgi:redox-sensitive bicupin YhaK (pirin superfamily)